MKTNLLYFITLVLCCILVACGNSSSKKTNSQNSESADTIATVVQGVDNTAMQDKEKNPSDQVPSTPNAQTPTNTQVSELNIAKIRGVMSVNDGYDAYDKRPKITAAERASLKIDLIKNPDFDTKWANSKLSKGKLIYEGENGRLQTIFFVEQDHGSDEFLVSYNKNGEPVDCIKLGSISVYGGDRGEGFINGDIVTSRFSAEGSSLYKRYKITPELKFKKTKEWEAED